MTRKTKKTNSQAFTISVIIPNFNGRELLDKNLPRVVKNTPSAEIIVVDDASTDDSVSFLKKKFPHIKVIEKKRNTGFSSTVNLGAESASGDLLVLLNSDVYPKKDYLKKVFPHFRDNSVFAVGFLQESHEDGRIVLRGRGEGEFKRGFLIHHRGDVHETDTLWVSGGAGVFRKSIWKKLGGFRKIYDPFYWEDIDLSFRAVNQGYRILFEKNARVIHSQNIGAIRVLYTPSQIKRIAYRNQFLFVWFNFGEPRYLFQHLFWLPYHLVKNRQKEFYLGLLQALIRF